MRQIMLIALILLLGMPAWADEVLNPPLTGEMYRLEILPKPVRVPEIVLASRPTGTKYLSDYRGKIILMNIWAVWCPPCVTEMPSLDALQKSMGSDKFVVLPVSIDKDMDGVKKFMDEKKLDSLVPYIDAEGNMDKLEILKDVDGVPVTLILNQNMEAVARFQGDADWSSKEAHAVLDYLITHVKPGVNTNDDEGPPGMKELRSLYQR